MDRFPTKAPPGWVEAVIRGSEEAERGDTVPAQVIFDEIRQILAEMEAEAEAKLALTLREH